MKWSDIDPKDQAELSSMYEGAVVFAVIKAQFPGVSMKMLKHNLGHLSAKRRRNGINLRRPWMKGNSAGLKVCNRDVEAKAKELKALIPDDTRSMTGRFFGDPLPGLSALDRPKPPKTRKYRISLAGAERGPQGRLI